ncbi:uncharacterized protein YbjT (DUF2867 family) [Thermosporothrix hazakensis]|jgi:uncharacterized protein YbjT (DUF2867 family)|uniref:Uncharacterized protein YbjT (DUF2867 family) n=1 Tax=Thermosporothrix hazakensis TaxID=644383 RepID=A0A326UAI9_THEHA|nr:NmrA family NAD(P)-binding protein [Thermosporothrix hazakensis]PZW32678.1 uncharacterized protein YbjT (DUF2867 family) [Thermosporothrix hazakensis]GCE50031.1 NAD(P)-dependent oxidoreductase [Thermosporothrix hazakensis]
MIVVTGPTGNVGAEVVRLLLDQRPAMPFRIAAHNPERLRALYGQDAPCVAFDYDDRSTWGAVLDGIQMLFLLFPLPHPRTVQTRMKPFIDAAVQAGCQHIVYVTVPGADASSVIPHYHVERHIERSGVAYTFLRASYFMQNLCRRISTHGIDIAEHNEIFIPAGNGLTSFIDARDVAAVVLDIFRDPARFKNRSYTLTGPERLSFFQVALVFSKVLQRPIRYARPSMFQFWQRLWRRGVAWDVIFFMTIVYTLTRLGKNALMTDELPALLGRPATTLEQFVADYRMRWETQEWT